MHSDSPEGHRELDRREGLVLDLADDAAVDGVGEVGAEAGDVERLGPVAGLLVDCEADPHPRPRHIGMRDEPGDGRHDLRDAGLVVGAEQRRPVARDDVVAHALREQRGSSPARGSGSRRPAGRSRRRRSRARPAGRRPYPAHRGSCPRGREARSSGRRRGRRRAASRTDAPPRSGRSRPARARGARRQAAETSRAASPYSADPALHDPTAYRSARTESTARARPQPTPQQAAIRKARPPERV